MNDLANIMTRKEVEALIEAAVLAEREACAKVCEKLLVNDDRDLFKALNVGITRCAAAIRARGEK